MNTQQLTHFVRHGVCNRGFVQRGGRWPGARATFVVANTNDSGAGSLRQAILSANSSVNVPDAISFNIAGTGPHTITSATALPVVTDPVTVDGYTAIRREREHAGQRR